MQRTDIVDAPIAVVAGGLAVACKAVGPHPVDVLDGAAGLLGHQRAKAVDRVAARAVGDGEVASRVVAVQEDCDVVDARGAVLLKAQRKPAVGCDVEGDVKRFCRQRACVSYIYLYMLGRLVFLCQSVLASS
jgi:hypothetical protein